MNKNIYRSIWVFVVGIFILCSGAISVESNHVQISYGHCSPNISNVAGAVTITCTGALDEAARRDIERRVQAAIKRGGDAKDREALRKTVEVVIREELGNRFLTKGYEYAGSGSLSVIVDVSPESESNPKALVFQATHDAGLYAGRLFSARDSIRLSEQGEQALSLLARGLARLKPKSILIQAHLSEPCPVSIAKRCHPGYRERISRAYAQKLSERAASAIKGYFEQQGMSPTSIYTEGRGLSKPLTPYPNESNLTPEAWEAAANKNFRADIAIQL